MRAKVEPAHGIRDNHKRGRVADFLIEKATPGSVLSIVSAYFTIYAYEALADKFDRIDAFTAAAPFFVLGWIYLGLAA